MGLPSDWYVNSGEASQAISQQNQLTGEIAKILLEIARRARLNARTAYPSELVELMPMAEFPAADPAIEVIDAQLLYDNPELASRELPLIESEIIPDVLALPSFQQRPEQIAADTIRQLTDELGDRGVYPTEAYTLRRSEQIVPIVTPTGEGAQMQAEETIYQVFDQQNREIFAFRDAGPNQGYDIMTNELGHEATLNLLNARQQIEASQGIAPMMSDPTFKPQLSALGDFAPAGSQAANFAHYALDGYEGNTMKTPRYTLSRDDSGNVTITRNSTLADRIRVKPAKTVATSGAPATTDVANHPNGQVLLKTAEGRVQIFNMNAQDRQGFAELFQSAQQKPLNQVLGEPQTPVSRRPIVRD
jgi:hypothetical protein